MVEFSLPSEKTLAVNCTILELKLGRLRLVQCQPLIRQLHHTGIETTKVLRRSTKGAPVNCTILELKRVDE